MKNEVKHTSHSSYRCEYHIVFAPNIDGSRNFWCRGYYVDTVGKNEKMIKSYIQNRLEEDFASDQLPIKEFKDPFTGEKRK